MRRGTLLCISLCLAVASFAFAGTFADAESRKVSGEVYAALDALPAASDEKVRVHITFDLPNTGRRRSIQATQPDIREIVGDDAIKHIFGDSISAFVTREELAQLEQTPGVSGVSLVGTRQIMLQSSVALVNATHTAPQQVDGINLTGLGRTVCVIDTGINYSHESLGGCYGNASASSTCKVWGGWDYCANNGNCATSDEVPDDIHGHGTHVAGIAVANGSIRGVAPHARVVMIKACNSSGTCFDDDIQAGINWCIGNRTALNISVISMSLGSGANTNYCNDDLLAPQINDAVGKNITVVVATGNDGSATGISAPSCVQNATSIAATNKNEAVDGSYSNRNNLTLLVAPGTSINSTAVGGGYTTLSGTSMATPHVAGVIAILTQYLNMTGRQRTPAQIVSTFNSTGRRINDAGSNWNYSRVNLYDAIISLDIAAPNVTFESPANGTTSLLVNQTFVCNGTDLALQNATFYLWNSSGGVQFNQTVTDISGSNRTLNVTVTNLSAGTYAWNCLFVDENNNSALVLSNRSITIASLTAMLMTPASTTIINSNQTYQCNASTSGTLGNATFHLWNSSSGLENTTRVNMSGVVNSTNFSVNFPREGAYEWNCLFDTTTNNQAFASANFTITYDVTRPRVNVTEPANKTWQNKANFNVSMNENGSCIGSLDGGVKNVSLSSTNNRAFNGTNVTLVHGTNYTAAYYCNDSAGNLNRSILQSFTVDLTTPNVTLHEPNTSYNLTASSTTVVFNYSVVEELNISSCSLILNGAANTTNVTISNLSANQSFTTTFATGNFNWSVNCTDEAGNGGNSSTRNLIITAPPSSDSGGSSGGGGGGGGGGGAVTTGTTYRPTTSDAQAGFTRPLKPSDSIKVSVPATSSGASGGGSSGGGGSTTSVEHTITLDSVNDTSASITVRSDPIKLVLAIGQSVKLNLTSPILYDLFIKLESIVNKSANITVRVINESITGSTVDSLGASGGVNANASASSGGANETSLPGEGYSETSKRKARWIRLIFILVVIILIMAIAVYLVRFWLTQQDRPWMPQNQASKSQ